MVGGSKKFFKNYSGPYILIEKISDVNFKIAQAHNNKLLKNTVFVNRFNHFGTSSRYSGLISTPRAPAIAV
jgi:hypothetical protein